jgi:hypothetical protein
VREGMLPHMKVYSRSYLFLNIIIQNSNLNMKGKLQENIQPNLVKEKEEIVSLCKELELLGGGIKTRLERVNVQVIQRDQDVYTVDGGVAFD